MKDIETLDEFYEIMAQSAANRRTIVERYFSNTINRDQDALVLTQTLEKLQSIPQKNNHFFLKLDQNHRIPVNLNYEINELIKDIYFLKNGEDRFYQWNCETYKTFHKEVQQGLQLLNQTNIRTLVTDRDGTINNYCGRYRSSIQSVYNAVYLNRIAARLPNCLLLTSAPLRPHGLLEVSTCDHSLITFAGSKGREFVHCNEKEGNFPIDKQKQSILNQFNSKLTDLLLNPEHHIFSLIGSGLQLKFGQTTVARQDIDKSIDEATSNNFLKSITSLVNDIDPDRNYLFIEDTGTDIEIILTVNSNDQIKDFDKGNGLQFLNHELKLNMNKGSTLVCGDTVSDLPMVKASMEISQNTYSIFATENPEIEKQLRKLSDKFLIVSNPDILISILNQWALTSSPE